MLYPVRHASKGFLRLRVYELARVFAPLINEAKAARDERRSRVSLNRIGISDVNISSFKHGGVRLQNFYRADSGKSAP